MWYLLLLLALGTGCTRGSLPASTGIGPAPHLPPDPSVAAPAPAPLRRFTHGEVLYVRYCADCHGWEGRGAGPAAELLEVSPPPLRRTELFTQYTEAELIARTLIGKELRIAPTSTPGLVTDTEETAILSHLRRLPTIPWQQVNAGQDVYDSLCVSCHGLYGRGDGLMAPALPAPPRDLSTPPYQTQVRDAELFTIISEGKGAMAGAADVLNAEEIQAVIAFLRLLSPGYELYDRLCAACHGPEGHPPELSPPDAFGFLLALEGLPTFDDTYFQTHTDQHIRSWIRHMLKENRATMPHFGGELNAGEIREILVYLRTLLPES